MREGFYRVLRVIATALIYILFPPKVRGRENIPAHSAALICSNHISVVDPVVLACVVDRPVRFIAKKELFQVKWINGFLRRLGAFPVDRGGSDLTAMRTSLSIIKDGGLMGIYPQGHRYKRDENKEIESGAALIALRTKAPVIPVRMSKYRLFRWLHINIGQPVELSDLWGKLDAASLKEATSRISRGIWGSDAPA